MGKPLHESTVLHLAFPHRFHLPPLASEFIDLPAIAIDVGSDLGFPEVRVPLRPYRAMTAIVTVPEATVNEDHGPPPWQDEVGPSRKATGMEYVA